MGIGVTGAETYRGRRIVIAIVMVAGFAGVIARFFILQVLHAGELTAKADRQHQKVVSVEGARGVIYDRQARMLAINMDVPSVFGVPSSLHNPSRAARDLARVLPVRADEIERKLRQERGFVWIARKLDPEQGRRLQDLSLDGIGTILEGRRFYPKRSLLSHVLGFADMDGEGLEGVERRYDSHLRGEKQIVVLQRDALGRTVFPKGIHERAPSAGHNLTLTIDEFIQYVAEKELDEGVASARAKSGMVIVMEPRTGEILAMALSPKFDPNAAGAVSADRLRNRAVTDTYEPGSTMKIIVAAAALEEKLMTPHTRLHGENGRMEIAGTVIHDHERLGWMSFAEVIQRSSNIGAAKVAMSLGDARFQRYVKAFGFGERTGIDLSGEVSGLVKEARDWRRRSLASMAIGQEIAVTALQLVTAVSAVANGGWLMRPYLVAQIRDAQGAVIAAMGPEARRQPISAETARMLTDILEGVVTHGTGTRAAVSGYRVAGKTGTAQKIDPQTRRYSATRFVGSFVGYVPAEDPRIAVVVILDEPQSEAWGGVVAAPVFKRIAEQVLPYLGVSSQEPVKLAMASPGG